MTKQDSGSGIQDTGLGIQDSGLGIQDASAGDKEPHQVSHPPSAILDPVSMERIRWRCRRGLLELDIVLGRFIAHYASLDTQQKIVFDILLDLPDTSLWDMVSGKLAAKDEDQHELLELINKA
jgi:antitoxin CptB